MKKILEQIGVKKEQIDQFSDELVKGFEKYKITTKEQKSAFLANAIHESNYFKSLQENLNYSVQGLLSTFPKRISKEQAQKFGYIKDEKGNVIQKSNKEEIANLAYGNRFGNSSTEGAVYFGRGIFQLTFKDNYRSYKEFSGVDVVSNPDLLLLPNFAVDSAFWFYTSNKIEKLKDLKEIRKKINGGLNGFKEVEELYNKIIKIM